MKVWLLALALMYMPKAAEKITAHLSSKERIIRPAEALRHSFIRILQWMIRQEKCKELWKTINNFHKLINNFVTIGRRYRGDGSAGTPSPRTEGTVCPVRQVRTEGTVPRRQFVRYGKTVSSARSAVIVPGGQFVRYGKRTEGTVRPACGTVNCGMQMEDSRNQQPSQRLGSQPER